MDYDDTYRENILAKVTWVTSGNIALHIMLDGGCYNYLYAAGNRATSYNEYIPAGRIYSRISFQHYERENFGGFSTHIIDDSVHRPRTLADPVHHPEEHIPNSGGNRHCTDEAHHLTR